MRRFELFDAIKLTEVVSLSNDGAASVGTPGAIVEVLNDGEAYLVELFGNWVKTDAEGDFIPTERTDPEAFMETLGVETVYPQQMRLVQLARETMGDLG